MRVLFAVIFLLVGNRSTFLFAQDVPFNTTEIQNEISFNYGMGHFLVRDDFLTTERYSGAMPFFSVDWTSLRENSGFRVLFSVHSSNKIQNRNMTADVLNFSLIRDYFVYFKQFQLFSKECTLLAGPSTEMFVYSNRQDYATDGIFLDLSFASLISLGANATMSMPLNNRLAVETDFRSNIFSLGIRMPLVNDVNGAENDHSRFKLLTVLKAINATCNWGLRSTLFKNLSVKAVYRFQFTNIRVWERLSSASDHFVLALSYHF